MSNRKILHGFHAINARLFQNAKSLIELYVTADRQDARMRAALVQAELQGVRVMTIDSARLDGMTGRARHQGIAALVDM